MITIQRYMHKSIVFLIEIFISKGYDFNIVVKSLNPDFSGITFCRILKYKINFCFLFWHHTTHDLPI